MDDDWSYPYFRRSPNREINEIAMFNSYVKNSQSWGDSFGDFSWGCHGMSWKYLMGPNMTEWDWDNGTYHLETWGISWISPSKMMIFDRKNTAKRCPDKPWQTQVRGARLGPGPERWPLDISMAMGGYPKKWLVYKGKSPYKGWL